MSPLLPLPRQDEFHYDITKPTRCTNFSNFISKIKFEKLMYLVGFVIRKFVTMHGHMNVKVITTVHNVLTPFESFRALYVLLGARKIKPRISMAQAALHNKQNSFTSTLELHLK
jgi:hypothetical protein